MDVFEQRHIYVNLFDYFDVDEDLNFLLDYKLMLNDNQESFVQMDHVNQSMVEVQVQLEQLDLWMMMVVPHEDEKDDVLSYYLLEAESVMVVVQW